MATRGGRSTWPSPADSARIRPRHWVHAPAYSIAWFQMPDRSFASLSGLRSGCEDATEWGWRPSVVHVRLFVVSVDSRWAAPHYPYSNEHGRSRHRGRVILRNWHRERRGEHTRVAPGFGQPGLALDIDIASIA